MTAGEPAGIGPDLCLALAAEASGAELIIIADRELLRERAELLKLTIPGTLNVQHVPLAAKVVPGRLDAANSSYVLRTLDAAIDGALRGDFHAVVTAPVQKSIINDAGVKFRGHTEYFAERCGAPLPVMMLVAGTLRVALATTHLPLAAVSAAISAPLLEQTLTILERELRERFGIAAPRIAVCGLNPHAGESGHLGDEEIRVIAPVIAALRARGLQQLHGPFPADTLFVPRQLAQFDAVLAMYHDQGLPVLKHAGFGHAVNVTLGLPIIRTSVDHGTALELAGTGRADAGSLRAALALAVKLIAQAATQKRA